jgi:hypothetical protein
MSPGVAVGERLGEVGKVAGIAGGPVRLASAVRPGGRAPDRDQELHPARLRVPCQLVDVVEPIGRVERCRRILRAARGRVCPGHGRADDGGAGPPRPTEHRHAPGTPAERRLVLEADQQTTGHLGLRETRQRVTCLVGAEDAECGARRDGGQHRKDGGELPHRGSLPAGSLGKTRELARFASELCYRQIASIGGVHARGVAPRVGAEPARTMSSRSEQRTP